jgi:DNA primase
LQYPDATAFVTEGEKDADNVAALGLCATTVASGKWTDGCVQALAGRDCWILEDNDDAGRKKAREAANLLHPVANSIKIIRLPGLAEGGDVSDWLDMGHTKTDRRLIGSRNPRPH